MGCVKNILAKDFIGNWMTLYSVDAVDPSVQALYSKFSQYRYFYPEICGTPFQTNHIRVELDTRSISDWNEIDFFEIGGTDEADESMVYWNGKVRDQYSIFHFHANDCTDVCRLASRAHGRLSTFLTRTLLVWTHSPSVRMIVQHPHNRGPITRER
jgi:hypothetical protein